MRLCISCVKESGENFAGFYIIWGTSWNGTVTRLQNVQPKILVSILGWGNGFRSSPKRPD